MENKETLQMQGSEKLPEIIRFHADISGTQFEEIEGFKKSWAQIFIQGNFKHPDGNFSVTEKEFDNIIHNFETGIRPKPPTEMVVDYDHGTTKPDATPEQSKAAGWVEKIKKVGKDLMAYVRWTPNAVKYIQNQEFRFTSPEFHTDWENPETGKKIGYTLLAVGLTNRPFLPGMKPITLSEKLLITESTEEVFGVKDELIKLFELAEDAKDEDILAKIKILMEANKKLSEIRGLLKLKDEEDIMAKIKSLTEEKKEEVKEKKELEGENKQLSERVVVLEGKIQTKEAEEAFALALKEGKVKPAQKEEMLELYKANPVLFGKIIEKAGKVVDFKEYGFGGEGRKEDGTYKNPSEEVAKRADEKIKKDEKLQLREAVEQVLAEDKELANQYYKMSKTRQ